MTVLDETIQTLQQRNPSILHDVRIEDLVIGIFFTGVKLSTGHAGVAFTPIGEIPEAVCCPTTAARMPQAGNLAGMAVWEVLHYAAEKNVLKSAIGVAAINGVTQLFLESGVETEGKIVNGVDGFDLLKIQPHETVSLIGAFGPYIRRLKMMGNPFFIIGRNPLTLREDERQFYRLESEMAPALEESNVIVMTGTAIVNHSIDTILSHLNKGIRSAIIGPTASMLPDAFFKRGVDVMAGVRILNSDSMISILKQGGSAYHLLKECSEKMAFVKNESF